MHGILELGLFWTFLYLLRIQNPLLAHDKFLGEWTHLIIKIRTKYRMKLKWICIEKDNKRETLQPSGSLPCADWLRRCFNGIWNECSSINNEVWGLFSLFLIFKSINISSHAFKTIADWRSKGKWPMRTFKCPHHSRTDAPYTHTWTRRTDMTKVDNISRNLRHAFGTSSKFVGIFGVMAKI